MRSLFQQTPLLFFAAAMLISVHGTALGAEGDDACQGESAKEASPKFCQEFDLQPITRDKHAATMKEECVAFYTKVLEGVELLCTYRKAADGFETRTEAAKNHAESQEQMFNGLKLIHQDASSTYGGLLDKFAAKEREVDAAFGQYFRQFKTLNQHAKEVLKSELTCRPGPSQVHSFMLFSWSTYSSEHAYESYQSIRTTLSQARKHLYNSRERRFKDSEQHAQLSRRLLNRAAGKVSPPGMPTPPEAQSPGGDIAAPGARQAGQFAGFKFQSVLDIPRSAPLVSTALNLGVRMALKGNLDWIDIASVSVPAMIGFGTGLWAGPQAGVGAALLAGFAADIVENNYRGLHDVTTTIKREYPRFALNKLKTDRGANSSSVAKAFHEHFQTKICQ